MTPAKRRSLLDSWALIAYLSGERSGAAVRDLLRAAAAADERLLMNEVNIGEVYYLLAKRRSPAAAEAFLRTFETMPIDPISNAFAEVTPRQS